MGNLNFQYPAGLLFLALLTGLLYAGILYYRENKFEDKSNLLRLGLFILRFLSISLISFFLLEPFFKSIKEEIRKPILVIAQDASQSIKVSHSKESIDGFTQQLKELSTSLKDKYEIHPIYFGENISSGFKDTLNEAATDYGQVFNFIDAQFHGLPVAGLVLFSDGLFNAGTNPLYSENINYPVYSIAVGDTLKRTDISIRNIFYNPIAFLGDSLAIQFDVHAFGLNEKRANITLIELLNGKEKILARKQKTINSNEFFYTEDFVLSANRTGTNQYKVRIEPIQNEVILSNNQRDLFIDIIDSRIQVLMLASHPHPDISAFKQILEENKNYEFSAKLLSDNPSVKDFDLVLLHNLPSSLPESKALIQKLKSYKIPHFFILGQHANLKDFNDSQNAISINNSGSNTYNLAQAIVNPGFVSFELDDVVKAEINRFPPLYVPYGEYESASDTRILLNQKIGAVNTAYPLLAFNDRDGLKTGILFGEGLWKWRLNEFGRNGNHNATKQLMHKSLQFLSIKEDKRKWQVVLDKKVWNENERIKFKAILYNDNFEAINGSEAKITIKNSSGDQFNFLFSRYLDHYTLDAGFLPDGRYSFVASNKAGGELLEFKGNFIVKSLQLELANLVARHDLLNQLSRKSGGKLYYPGQIDELSRALISKDEKSIVFSSERYMNILNFKWLFFLILGLVSIEWFLRRYHGSY